MLPVSYFEDGRGSNVQFQSCNSPARSVYMLLRKSALPKHIHVRNFVFFLQLIEKNLALVFGVLLSAWLNIDVSSM